MSFLERVINRVTSNPEADAAYNAQLAKNREACTKELAIWQTKSNELSVEDFKKSTLPEDLLYFKQFITTRLAVLRPKLLSQEAIDALNATKDTENYNLMMTTRLDRTQFKRLLEMGDPFYKRAVDDFKERKIPEPPEFKQLLAIAHDGLKWFDITKFVEKDVYADKLKEMETKGREILIKLDADLRNPDAVKAAAVNRHNAEMDTFSIPRMIAKILGIIFTIVGSFLLIFLGLFGASLATNLNLYRGAWFRVLYAFYGFLYFFLVIPYSLLYRWWWKGKRPRFYSFIPLIPFHFDNYYAGLLFSWMSYKPDDQIESLKEWEAEQKE